jgi:hypothetical protein
MKHIGRCLLLGAILTVNLPAFAQYAWIDDTGHRVFSDQPPPARIPQKNILSGHATPIAAKVPAAPAAIASNQGLGQDQALEQKEKAADAAAATKKQAEEQKRAAQRADNCQRARTGLAGLQSGVRIAQFDAQGQRFYITDEQRAAEIQRTQSIIAADCR